MLADAEVSDSPVLVTAAVRALATAVLTTFSNTTMTMRSGSVLAA